MTALSSFSSRLRPALLARLSREPGRAIGATISCLALLVATPATFAAMDGEEEDPKPAVAESDPEKSEAAATEMGAAFADPDYLLPDLAPAALILDGPRFWFKPIFAMVGDYTLFDQDDASLAQVGEQEDTQEVRAARLGFTSRSKGDFAWDFYVTTDYQERSTREKTVFQIFDLKVGIPLGRSEADDRQTEAAVLLRVDRALGDPAAPGADPARRSSSPAASARSSPASSPETG